MTPSSRFAALIDSADEIRGYRMFLSGDRYASIFSTFEEIVGYDKICSRIEISLRFLPISCSWATVEKFRSGKYDAEVVLLTDVPMAFYGKTFKESSYGIQRLVIGSTVHRYLMAGIDRVNASEPGAIPSEVVKSATDWFSNEQYLNVPRLFQGFGNGENLDDLQDLFSWMEYDDICELYLCHSDRAHEYADAFVSPEYFAKLGLVAKNAKRSHRSVTR